MMQIMIVVPVGIYFAAFYPDWSWMYLIDTATLNVGVVSMAIVSYPLTAVMGYLVGYYSARSASDWVTVMFIIFMTLGIFILLAIGRNQLFMVGTYQQYHRNVGLQPLASTSLFPSILLAWSGVGICWGYLIYRFIQEGRLSLRTL
jgi:hypothetical protein